MSNFCTRLGLTILVGLLICTAWAVALGYCFIADWTGHWIIGGIFVLFALGLTLCIVGELYKPGGLE